VDRQIVVASVEGLAETHDQYYDGALPLLSTATPEPATVLGAKFSLRQFHNKVLMTGTVPLELLDRQVDAWMKSQA
jgi:uncharacterized protein (DUF885 family)